MAVEVNFGTPLKDMDVGFNMGDLLKVKVVAVDANGFNREIEYEAADVPEAVMTDLEAIDVPNEPNESVTPNESDVPGGT